MFDFGKLDENLTESWDTSRFQKIKIWTRQVARPIAFSLGEGFLLLALAGVGKLENEYLRTLKTSPSKFSSEGFDYHSTKKDSLLKKLFIHYPLKVGGVLILCLVWIPMQAFTDERNSKIGKKRK